MIQIRINEEADISADQNGAEIRIEKASIYLSIEILKEAVQVWENVFQSIGKETNELGIRENEKENLERKT